MTSAIDTVATDPFDQQHLWHPYSALLPKYPNLCVQRADGVWLHLKGGTRLLDGMSSWWAVIHGYNHPKLNMAIREQLDDMAHVMFGGLTHQPAIDLGKRLLAIAPTDMDAIFYADSGSVAVEVALKMALQYQIAAGKPHKNHFATTRSGYYGDTWHAMSICDPVTGMHSLYGNKLPMQHFVPPPPLGFDRLLTGQDTQALHDLFATHHEQMAAFIIEPIVQGAGGMRFYAPAYLQQVRSLCDQYDVLLIADEIATGFGRTGRLFACEHASVHPDIMTVGKALTGGYLSFAATLCTRHVATTISQSDYDALMHGPTFMGNPLACAVANASLALVQALDSPALARRIEKQLQSELASAAEFIGVTSVRCLGAIGVIELQNPVNMAQFQALLIAQGIWVRPFGRLVYIMPPLVITPDELTQLTEALLRVLKRYLTGHAT